MIIHTITLSLPEVDTELINKTEQKGNIFVKRKYHSTRIY